LSRGGRNGRLQSRTRWPTAPGPVAELTGLPEPLVQQELHEILESAGQNAGSVTLDALREAMLLYLEAMAEPLERAERELAEKAALEKSLNPTTAEDLSFIPSI
jgi:hypothetical protein